QAQGPAEGGGRLLRRLVDRLSQQVVEDARVEVRGRQGQLVAAFSGEQDVATAGRPEAVAQLEDGAVQRCLGVRRELVIPQQGDQPVSAHHLAGTGGECRQEGRLTGARK